MRRATVLLSAIGGMLLLACGGGSGQVEVTTADFSFSPTSWEVRAGEETPLLLTNQGANEHEFVIMKTPIENEEDFAEDTVLWEVEVAAGASKSDTIPALEAGTYQVICGLKGHFASGMVAELVVKA